MSLKLHLILEGFESANFLEKSHDVDFLLQLVAGLGKEALFSAQATQLLADVTAATLIQLLPAKSCLFVSERRSVFRLLEFSPLIQVLDHIVVKVVE